MKQDVDGEKIAELLYLLNGFAILTDEQLEELLSGLTFLFEFNRAMGFTPEATYYGQNMERVQRYIEARK